MTSLAANEEVVDVRSRVPASHSSHIFSINSLVTLITPRFAHKCKHVRLVLNSASVFARRDNKNNGISSFVPCNA